MTEVFEFFIRPFKALQCWMRGAYKEQELQRIADGVVRKLRNDLEVQKILADMERREHEGTYPALRYK